MPAIGCLGEPGPEEISRCGEGMRLVPPGDPELLAAELEAILSEPAYLADLGARARQTSPSTSRGRRAAARPSPPTRTRCGDQARPVRHEPRGARPRRRVPGAARARRASSCCCSAAARTTRPARSTTPACRIAPSSEREIARLAREGRAVICGTAGRRALPERVPRRAPRASVPFLLWSALWHEPRTPAHLAARPLMRHIHRRADAVVTYGPHVSAHARRLGARARLRGAAGGRQRVVGRSRRPCATHRRSPPCLRGATCGQRAWRSCARRGLTGRRLDGASCAVAAGRDARPSCATSTRPPTSW